MKPLLAPFCLIAALAASPASAAVVTFDLTNIGSNNANIASITPGTSVTVLNPIPPLSAGINVLNGSVAYGGSAWGIQGANAAIEFSVISAANTAPNPKRHLAGETLDSSLQWSSGGVAPLFSAGPYYAAIPLDWVAGSHLGFRVKQGSADWFYGYFEVTWVRSTTTLSILSGAYESQINTAITIPGGGGSSAVPEAGPGPALALLLGGLGLRQWRRTRRTGAAA